MAWLNLDPAGLICAFFTHVLLLLGVFGSLSFAGEAASVTIAALLLVFAASMAAWAHLKTMLTNPGTVPKLSPNAEIVEISRHAPELRNGELVTTCKRCPAYRPERAHHCSTCGHCVRMMDHHCPWVNNCVGERNQRFFIQFTGYIFLAACCVLGVLISHFVACRHRQERSCFLGERASLRPLAIIGLAMEAFIFGLFTLIMTCDQVCSILGDTSYIDKLQHKQDRERGVKPSKVKSRETSYIHRLAVVFGNGPWYTWILPIEAPPLVRRLDHYPV